MAASGDTSFDDPGLKAALRLKFSDEKAPSLLAERIRNAMAAQNGQNSGAPVPAAAAASASATYGRIVPDSPRSSPGDADIAPRGRFGPMRFYGWVAAAMLLLSVTLVGLNFWQSARPAGAASIPLPDALAQELVHRHDMCCENAKIHRGPGIPQNGDFPGMERVLHHDLQHRVMVADLTLDGWKFRGCAECLVGKIKTAHIIYDRDGGSISIFSLPASMFPAAHDGTRFTAVWKDHPIVGVVADGAIFCMVQSQPGTTPSLQHLQELFDEHEAESSVAQSNFPAKQLGSAPEAENQPASELLHEVARTSVAQR